MEEKNLPLARELKNGQASKISLKMLFLLITKSEADNGWTVTSQTHTRCWPFKRGNRLPPTNHQQTPLAKFKHWTITNQNPPHSFTTHLQPSSNDAQIPTEIIVGTDQQQRDNDLKRRRRRRKSVCSLCHWLMTEAAAAADQTTQPWTQRLLLVWPISRLLSMAVVVVVSRSKWPTDRVDDTETVH